MCTQVAVVQIVLPLSLRVNEEGRVVSLAGLVLDGLEL